MSQPLSLLRVPKLHRSNYCRLRTWRGCTSVAYVEYPTDAHARAQVMSHTVQTRPDGLPEVPVRCSAPLICTHDRLPPCQILLRLITPECPLWRGGERELPFPLPYWAFAWPGQCFLLYDPYCGFQGLLCIIIMVLQGAGEYLGTYWTTRRTVTPRLPATQITHKNHTHAHSHSGWNCH